jgi:hypothetical protein
MPSSSRRDGTVFLDSRFALRALRLALIPYITALDGIAVIAVSALEHASIGAARHAE